MDGQKSLRMTWKFFRMAGKFLDDLESFWKARKVSGQSSNFTTYLEMPEVYYNMDKIADISHQKKLSTETIHLSQK